MYNHLHAFDQHTIFGIQRNTYFGRDNHTLNKGYVNLDLVMVNDVEFMRHNTTLSELDLGRTGPDLVDLSPLQQNTTIETLAIGEWCNPQLDLSTLSGNTSLVTVECAMDLLRTDLSFVNTLPSLERLDVGFEGDVSLEPLAINTTLNTVFIARGTIPDPSPLARNTTITSLGFDECDLPNVNFVRYNTTIESLILEGCTNIADLHPFSFNASITTLVLETVNVTDVSPLAKMERLRDLTIADIHIDNVNDLVDANIRALKIERMPWFDFSSLSRMTSLTSLMLPRNQLSDIEFLSPLTNLQALDIGENHITSIKGIDSLAQLYSACTILNQISDFSPLFGNATLRYLVHYSNPYLPGHEEIVNDLIKYNRMNEENRTSSLFDLVIKKQL